MGCPATAKVQYESLEEAEKAIPKLIKKYGESGSPYFCIFCDKWHLGTFKSSKKRRKRT